MGEDNTNSGHIEAQRMLDAFGSVGATRFDMTWTNTARENRSSGAVCRFTDLRRTLPAILDHVTQKRRNVIVRPHGPHVTFIQLDDRQIGVRRGGRISRARNLARQLPGMGRHARQRGQGSSAPPAERRRSRYNSERRNARRRPHQLQGQIRAQLPARHDPSCAARPNSDSARA
jgi:hypothetical protein